MWVHSFEPRVLYVVFTTGRYLFCLVMLGTVPTYSPID